MGRQKWTREKIAEVISTYPSLKKFRKDYSSAYDAMKRNGWEDLKELVVRKVPVQDNTLKWTPDHIQELVQTCKNISEFCRIYPRAYEKVKAKKWSYLLDGIRQNVASTEWTREKIAGLIKKCSSLPEFRSDYLNAYQAMLSHGWIDLADGLSRIPAEAETSETKWSVYRWYFPERNAVYIGLTKQFAKRVKAELQSSRTSPVKDFLAESGCTYEVREIYTGLSSDDASRLEIETIRRSRDEGYLVLNRSRGGTLGGRIGSSYTKVHVIARYGSDGSYIGSVLYDDRRDHAESAAIKMEIDGECARAEVFSVSVPKKVTVG